MRSESGRDYFIDPGRQHLGEYYVDEDGRAVFQNERGEPYYFGIHEGQTVPIVICPPYRPTVRSVARPAAGNSLGNGAYKKGIGIGAY